MKKYIQEKSNKIALGKNTLEKFLKEIWFHEIGQFFAKKTKSMTPQNRAIDIFQYLSSERVCRAIYFNAFLK